MRSGLLWVAAALVTLSLGVAWTSTAGTVGILSPGYTGLTNQFNVATGDLDLVPQYLPGYYIPGSPGTPIAGYASDARVGLVPALVVFAWALIRPSRQSRRATGLAALGLLACALWGISHGPIRGPLLAAAAAGLAAWASVPIGQRPSRASGPDPLEPTVGESASASTSPGSAF